MPMGMRMMIVNRSLSLQTIELSVMYVSIHMKKGIHVSGVNKIQNMNSHLLLIIGVLQYAKGNQMKWIHKVMNNNLLLLIVVLHVLMKVITTFSETDLKIWLLFANS